MKMTMMMPGWSARGGQTVSPYVGPIEDGETLLGHSVSRVLSSKRSVKP
jgi:amidase